MQKIRELLHAFLVVVVVAICWGTNSPAGLIGMFIVFVVATYIFPFSRKIYRARTCPLGFVCYFISGVAPVAAAVIGIVATGVGAGKYSFLVFAVFYAYFYHVTAEQFYNYTLAVCGGTREDDPPETSNFYLWASLIVLIVFAGATVYLVYFR